MNLAPAPRWRPDLVRLSALAAALTLLFAVTPSDPITFLAGALAMMVVALAASWIPAWRAMRVDPLVALRHE